MIDRWLHCLEILTQVRRDVMDLDGVCSGPVNFFISKDQPRCFLRETETELGKFQANLLSHNDQDTKIYFEICDITPTYRR